MLCFVTTVPPGPVSAAPPGPVTVGPPGAATATPLGPAAVGGIMASDLERNLKSLILPAANQKPPSDTPPGSTDTPPKVSTPPPMPKIGMVLH